jgi:MoxR-like ATPase
MLTVAAGAPLIELIALCYAARQPILLLGKHGIGKSDLPADAARELGVSFISLDLSLMEPVDLVGIPRIESDGRTHYAPPSFLPSDGSGVLVFEELNRVGSSSGFVPSASAFIRDWVRCPIVGCRIHRTTRSY